MKTSKKKKNQRNELFAPVRRVLSGPCPNCGQYGAHFVTPHHGDPGFFICDKPQ